MSVSALLCLGSNMPDVAHRNIDEALHAIEIKIGHITASSGKYDTPAYHKGQPVAGARYHNEVVSVSTDLDVSAIDVLCKEIEAALGRNEDTRRRGLVPIDVDVVTYGGHVMRPLDFNSPFFKKGYSKLSEE